MTGDGAELLDQLHQALTRYVSFPSPEAADAVTLWTAATHAQRAWEHAPRLVLTSPQKRCGKSRAQDVIAETCYARLITVNATVPGLVRSLGEDPPTLLVDEADTIFGTKTKADQNEDLRGILNAGHQRNRPMIRWDVTTRSREELPTFAMACLASIGDLPDTIMDRAIVVRMRRRAPSEQVAPYRTRRDGPPLRVLGDDLRAWVGTNLAELEKAEPAMPLEDRAADTWEPLISVADLAGGDWPKRAREAAVKMVSAESSMDDDDGAKLLEDIRTVFNDPTRGGIESEKMETHKLISYLKFLQESPWDSVNRGKGLDARGLSMRLRPYGIKPHVIRILNSTPRGYERADFVDAWTRYLP
jgi:hypothetical protein